MPIAIIVHGGAGDIAPERRDIVEAGCKEAALVGWRVLLAGGAALDAVEAAVRALEDNPEFNAGTGACLNSDGNIQLDAGIMDGVNLQVGAVAVVERIKNPISLARLVLESPHVLLVGSGAQRFAREKGINQCAQEDLITDRQRAIWQKEKARHESEQQQPDDHGTVGAVALDMHGALAAATSTGGTYSKYPGRVGDSPLVGCGFYADEYAAVSCTGYGEHFMRLLVAKRAADAVASGLSAERAAKSIIVFLDKNAPSSGGLIIVDRHGGIGFDRNSNNLAHAYIMEGMAEPTAGV
jgi:L-asparaginase / beta-aspartyl-peptidase